MKKILKTLFVISSCLLLTSCGEEASKNQSHDQNDTTQDAASVIENSNKEVQKIAAASCVDLGFEDIVDLRPYIRSNTVAVNESSSFKNNFKVDVGNGIEEITPEVVRLNMSALYQMYIATSTVQANIRGVKFSLGLSGKKIVYLLQNVIMKCSASATVQGGLYTYTPVPTDNFYKCDPTGTTNIVSLDDFTTLCNTYTANIRIKHKPTENPGRFTEGGTWKDDTRGVIFSYQEIFHYYHLNNGCNGGTNDYNQDLFLYSGAAEKKDGDQKKKTGKGGPQQTDEKVNKHTIFISSYNIDEKVHTVKNLDILLTDIANLAHLCPPSCFPVYKITNKKNCLYP